MVQAGVRGSTGLDPGPRGPLQNFVSETGSRCGILSVEWHGVTHIFMAVIQGGGVSGQNRWS